MVTVTRKQWKAPKRWTSSKVCPRCGSRATKLFNLSANDKPLKCQICSHRYDPPPRAGEPT